MAVLGEREPRNARRRRGPSAFKEGKGSDWKQDSRPRSHQQFRAFANKSKPICRPSLTSQPQASKELTRPNSMLAHSLPAYAFCLNQVERFFRLITRHAHPASPTS